MIDKIGTPISREEAIKKTKQQWSHAQERSARLIDEDHKRRIAFGSCGIDIQDVKDQVEALLDLPVNGETIAEGLPLPHTFDRGVSRTANIYRSELNHILELLEGKMAKITINFTNKEGLDVETIYKLSDEGAKAFRDLVGLISKTDITFYGESCSPMVQGEESEADK